MAFERTLQLGPLLARKSFFLLGPRATGKSTLVEHQLPDTTIYDLLDDDVYTRLLKRPRALGEEIASGNAGKLVVIDEIQKLPGLLDEVQRLIDKQGVRFLLTGSSARKLRRGGANLLAGRAWPAALFPLTSAEIPRFDLLQYLNRGGLPAIYPSEDYAEELSSYANLYLREEIVAEALVRKVDSFARFLDVIALSNGEELHYQGISNDAGVPVRTVQSFVQILEDTLLGFTVPAFGATRRRKAITRPKFFLFDVGVTGTLARRGEIRERSELFGRALEHFIALELRAYLSYRRRDEMLCYWRSTSGFEVDLILGDQLAVEVKASRQASEHDLRGLRALREEGLVRRYAVVSLDDAKRKLDGIEIWPWRSFLNALWRDTLV
jgi:uncharacterized protein